MGWEKEQQIVPSNPKLETKSHKGGFALLHKFILRKSPSLPFLTPNAGQNLQWWAHRQLAKLFSGNRKMLKPFFFFFPAIWFLLMGDLQRNRPAPEECLRLLQMARSLRTSKPAEQTGCGTPKSSQNLHILSHTDLNTTPCSSEMPSAPQEQLKPNHMQLSVWSLHKQVLRLC